MKKIPLFKLQHYNFWIGTQTYRWSPGAGAAGGEDLHSSDPAHTIDNLAVDAARHPTPRDELAEVSVTGEL